MNQKQTIENRLNAIHLKHEDVTGSGYLVHHKTKELFGRTTNTDPFIKGKYLVYFEDGSKMVCKEEKFRSNWIY